jgi:DNA-binding Xre family transcriptional regulator
MAPMRHAIIANFAYSRRLKLGAAPSLQLPHQPGLAGAKMKGEIGMTLEQLLKSVGTRIAELRAKRNLTQKSLSDKTGVTYRYLQTIESGRANVTLGTLHRLAAFLHVRVPDIVAPAGTTQAPPAGSSTAPANEQTS